jgi:hypothetical protein
VNKPVLFCYDGSEGSKTALAAGVELIKPAERQRVGSDDPLPAVGRETERLLGRN